MRWKVPFRRRNKMGGIAVPAPDVAAAIAERQRAQAELDATRRRQAHEEETVAKPLRRTRADMLAHNHVIDSLQFLLRGGEK
jgi:hypothetical protein